MSPAAGAFLFVADAGNSRQCYGIGLAEFTNQRTIDSIDRKITAINCITGLHPAAAMIPIAFETDREVITAALQTVGLVEPPQSRVIQVSDTLHLGECLVSEAYLAELATREDLTILSDPTTMAFDEQSNLLSVTSGVDGTAGL